METWRPISDFEYEVSDLGRVRSLKSGRVKILKPQRHTGGYRKVTLWRGGIEHQHLMQKLVLTAFVGPRPPGMQACHNDGDETNNALSNLRWDTPRANQADRIEHGTRFGRSGSRGKRRVTPAIVAHVRSITEPNITALARELSLPRTTVADIVNHRTYKGVN